jgi:hypothetical protein
MSIPRMPQVHKFLDKLAELYASLTMGIPHRPILLINPKSFQIHSFAPTHESAISKEVNDVGKRDILIQSGCDKSFFLFTVLVVGFVNNPTRI